ncbi:MAG TPA: hypothetical protein VM536_04225 [Chloroflexia bacterium]|nr:hypothetical protein [Chloroflexia bacterium]
MALKLHDQYGYSYTNLKVLLGGWNAWQAAGYPSVLGAPAATPAGGGPVQVVITPKP